MNRRLLKKISIVISVFFIAMVCAGLIFFYRFSTYIEKETGLNIFTFTTLLVDGQSMLKTTDDRVNILLLGIGGGNHEGPDLTDTIIIASFEVKTKQMSLISVPRDIWSDTLQDKVNSAYHYGELKKKGGGIPYAKTIVEDIVGVPMHYVLIYDFSKFESFIDLIGGIDVIVSSEFTDEDYPIEGKENDFCDGDPLYRCRYQTVQFDKGLEHMNGKRALIYSRSRHADGTEGNDFSRGKRQQEILVAIKAKIFNQEPWFHPSLAIGMFQSVDNATDTDMTVAQLLAVGKLILNIKEDKVKQISFESQLIEAPVWKYDRYALEPESDYESLHEFIRTQIDK